MGHSSGNKYIPLGFLPVMSVATTALLLGCLAWPAAALRVHTHSLPLRSATLHARVLAAEPPRASPARLCAVERPPPPPPPIAQNPLGKARAWVGKYAKLDKKALASLGFDAFFTYGFVSNINGAATARA
eukprot:2777547-Prymnesium_polylepis.1